MGKITGHGAVWLARMVWDHEVGSSNLPAPTIERQLSANFISEYSRMNLFALFRV